MNRRVLAHHLPRIIQVEARYLQPAGPARFGEVVCRFEPLVERSLAGALGESTAVVAGMPPEGHPLRKYTEAVHAALKGKPHLHARITWIGGRNHPVDTNRFSMECAARFALLGALHLCGLEADPLPPSARIHEFDGDGRKLWALPGGKR